MTKTAIAALLLASLTGCGVSPLHAATSKATAATRIMSSGSLAITAASENDGASANGLLPASEDFTLVGTDDDGKFSMTMHAVNPQGDLYVPKPDTVKVNGVVVPAGQYAALGKRLSTAKASGDARGPVLRATSILQLGH